MQTCSVELSFRTDTPLPLCGTSYSPMEGPIWMPKDNWNALGIIQPWTPLPEVLRVMIKESVYTYVLSLIHI